MQPIPELGADGVRHTSPIRFILSVVGRQKAGTLWGAVTSAVWMSTTALIPLAIGRAIDRGISDDDMDQLLLWCGVVLALGVVRAATGIAFYRQSIITRVVSGAITLRVVTEHLTRLGSIAVRRHRADDLIATSTADITAIGIGMAHTGRVVGSVASIVAVAVTMLVISPPLGLLVLVVVPLLTALSSLLLRPLHDRQDTYRDLQGRLAGHAVDIASGLGVLRGVGGERKFAARFKEGSGRLRRADAHVADAEADLAGSRVVVPGLVTVIVTYTAARFALDEHLSVGEVVMFYGFATSLLMPLTDFMEGTSQLTRALVAARRVTTLLDEPVPDHRTDAAGERTTADPEGDSLVDPTSGLVVPPATFLAVVCADPEDAGPLAARLAGVDGSGVLLGARALNEMPVATVRSRVLLGLNGHRFFTGTVREEVDPEGRADDAALAAALEAACATDIVDALPHGVETRITGRGRTFSGGQLQRLRLARALLKEADVTVLVEPTNAVDAYTEFTVAENLARIHGGQTNGRSTVVFTASPIIAHRAHAVNYVAGGRVVATGRHDDLAAEHDGYRAVTARDHTR